MRFFPNSSLRAVVLALGGVVCFLQVAPIQASIINPFSPVPQVPDIFTDCFGCTVLASSTQTATSSNLNFEATLVAAVFMDPNAFAGVRAGAGLDFYYQITNETPCAACTSGPIDISRFETMNFGGFLVDIGFTVASIPGFVDPVTGSATPGLVDRFSPGNTIGWDFSMGPGSVALSPGTTSLVLAVMTNATGWSSGGTASADGLGFMTPTPSANNFSPAVDGGTVSFNAFQPEAVPEPASVLLIAAGLLGLISIRRFRGSRRPRIGTL